MNDEPKKVLRVGSQSRWITSPERPALKPETAESIPDSWIEAFDKMSAREAEIISAYDPVFARRVDLLLAKRRNNYGF